MVNLKSLTTETRNAETMNLDSMSTLEVLQTMNNEDKKVPESISKELVQITKVVDATIQAFNQDGRLIYLGAGTSGRLGVLDAAECVPTFGTEPEMVQGLIAGGIKAMTVAVEGAEDSIELGRDDLKAISLTEHDIVIGLAASGRTPYVIGALEYANEMGAETASISCNRNSLISKYANYPIEVEVGPEVLTGSTRLKSGTAQKLILNMISTASMIGIGKVYKNLMVDVRPTNEKLVERAKRIIMEATGSTYEVSEQMFFAADQDVKTAIVMILTGSTKEDAIEKLKVGNGFIQKTL